MIISVTYTTNKNLKNPGLNGIEPMISDRYSVLLPTEISSQLGAGRFPVDVKIEAEYMKDDAFEPRRKV